MFHRISKPFGLELLNWYVLCTAGMKPEWEPKGMHYAAVKIFNVLYTCFNTFVPSRTK
jgi:hypothetical protein